MPHKTILLASHGTQGARAAEVAALQIAQEKGAKIIHLYIIPDFWRGMRGDDWLNNAITQKGFADYLEGELANEARIEIERLKGLADQVGVAIKTRTTFGKPVDSLISVADEEKPYLIIIGTPRLKGEQGYNSRIELEPLVRSLKARLLIVPRTL
jgi:nucleotide-binding universal stress UspA family protein